MPGANFTLRTGVGTAVGGAAGVGVEASSCSWLLIRLVRRRVDMPVVVWRRLLTWDHALDMEGTVGTLGRGLGVVGTLGTGTGGLGTLGECATVDGGTWTLVGC